ncbi:MAG: peptidoglycan DD-metalloendopeptidase family protein [Chloroflexota bacterium]
MQPASDRRGWSWVPGPRRSARARRRVVFLLLLPALLGGMFGAAPATRVAGDELTDAIAAQKSLQRTIAAQKAQVSQLSAQQSALTSRIASTAATLDGLNADLAAVRQQVTDVVAEAEATQASYDSLVAQIQVLDTELARLAVREAEKRDDLAARKALLAERIRNAYDTDRTTLLETVLSGADFTDVISEVGYYLDIGEQDRALAQQIVRDQETLAAIHQSVVSTRRQAEDLRSTTAEKKALLDEQHRQLEATRRKLENLEERTANALAAQQTQYRKMAVDKVALEAAIAKAAAAQAALARQIKQLVARQSQQGKIPSVYNGTLKWPMSGTITQEFGCTGFAWEPPSGSCRHFHKGIDIAAPLYTPIKAAGAGTVVFAGPNPYDPSPKAWIVVIAHSTKLLTWYAHVDNKAHPIQVKAGQTVRQGQVIAYEGLTGRTTGPHLHWMVELDDRFVNPRLFL